MSSVPVSVGSALALTQSFVRGEDPVAALADVVRRSAAADQVRLPIERLKSWQAAGAGLVLVELPRPGRLGLVAMLPRATQDAALTSGEVLLIADGSGALVPTLDEYGPADDRGATLSWEHLPGQPIPEYRYRMLDRRQVEQDLIGAVRAASRALTGLVRGWASGSPPHRPHSVALPPGIPLDLADLIERAAGLAGLALDGLAAQDLSSSLDLHTAAQRGAALRSLSSSATSALVDATNLACIALADAGGTEDTQRVR